MKNINNVWLNKNIQQILTGNSIAHCEEKTGEVWQKALRYKARIGISGDRTEPTTSYQGTHHCDRSAGKVRDGNRLYPKFIGETSGPPTPPQVDNDVRRTEYIP